MTRRRNNEEVQIGKKFSPRDQGRQEKYTLGDRGRHGGVSWHGTQCSYGCDTLIVEGLLERLAEEKEIIIAPSVHYSPSTYAVRDEKSRMVHVAERTAGRSRTR